MPAYEPWVPGGIYGTGESQDWTNGEPTQANYFGQPGWWNLPTSWFVTNRDGVIYASPTAPFPIPFIGFASCHFNPTPPGVPTGVTVVTSTPHGLSVGDTVIMSGSDAPFFNGTMTVTLVIDANTFMYEIPNDQGRPFLNRVITGQTPDPRPIYACKINLDGAYVFQYAVGHLLSGNANPFLLPRG